MPFILSKKSLAKLDGVKPKLVAVVKRAIEISAVDFSVIEGLRTKERQEQLVKSGNSQTMNSRHLVGEAVDLCPYINGGLAWDNEPDFTHIAEAMRRASIELKVSVTWGRAWLDHLHAYDSAADAMRIYVATRRRQGRKPFMDGPHFELS